MDTLRIINDYYAAWISGDRDKARSFLADNLRFRSPMDNFDSAEDFLNVCWKFNEGFDNFEPLHTAADADTAYVAYNVGDMHVGEFHRFAEGRIAEVYVTFNVTA